MSDKKDYQLDLQRRPRRLRQTGALRALVEETDLKPAHLIQPLFVLEGSGKVKGLILCPGSSDIQSIALLRSVRV